MNELEKCAEILVSCGYATDWLGDEIKSEVIIWIAIEKGGTFSVQCNPFADTLEGRRQADAIEDYCNEQIIDSYGETLWGKSESAVDYHDCENSCERQWRLDRIKWCIQELSNE